MLGTKETRAKKTQTCSQGVYSIMNTEKVIIEMVIEISIGFY